MAFPPIINYIIDTGKDIIVAIFAKNSKFILIPPFTIIFYLFLLSDAHYQCAIISLLSNPPELLKPIIFSLSSLFSCRKFNGVF